MIVTIKRIYDEKAIIEIEVKREERESKYSLDYEDRLYNSIMTAINNLDDAWGTHEEK